MRLAYPAATPLPRGFHSCLSGFGNHAQAADFAARLRAAFFDHPRGDAGVAALHRLDRASSLTPAVAAACIYDLTEPEGG